MVSRPAGRTAAARSWHAPLPGLGAGIAATGNTIDVSSCDYFRVGSGALIEHRGVMGAAGMMRQLTAL
jgi:hypothetical protein